MAGWRLAELRGSKANATELVADSRYGSLSSFHGATTKVLTNKGRVDST